MLGRARRRPGSPGCAATPVSGGTGRALDRMWLVDTRMDFDEHDTHLLMTHVTSVLLGLEILRDRTSLSDRQGAIVEHALRAANGMRDVLQERASAPPRAPTRQAHAPDPAPTAE